MAIRLARRQWPLVYAFDLAKVFLWQTPKPLPIGCSAPVETLYHQHPLSAKGRDLGISHGQSVGFQQPQAQPFVVDKTDT